MGTHRSNFIFQSITQLLNSASFFVIHPLSDMSTSSTTGNMLFSHNGCPKCGAKIAAVNEPHFGQRDPVIFVDNVVGRQNLQLLRRELSPIDLSRHISDNALGSDGENARRVMMKCIHDGP